jgi:hypothetical protein
VRLLGLGEGVCSYGMLLTGVAESSKEDIPVLWRVNTMENLEEAGQGS